MSSYIDKQRKINLAAEQRKNLEVIEDFMTSVLLQLIEIEPSFAPSTNIHNYSASMGEDFLVFQASKVLSERSRRNVKSIILDNLKEKAGKYKSDLGYFMLDLQSVGSAVHQPSPATSFYITWSYTCLGDAELRRVAFHENCQEFYGSLRCVREEQMVLLGMLPAVPSTLKATLRPSLQTITKFFEDRKDKHVITFNKEQFAKHFRRAGESDLLFQARVDLHFKQANLFSVFALTHIIITRDTNHNPVQLGGGL